jgi:hypothetical protein
MVALMSSVLMNGPKKYASRMMLLLAPVSASALRLVTHYQFSGWLLGSMLLLA